MKKLAVLFCALALSLPPQTHAGPYFDLAVGVIALCNHHTVTPGPGPGPGPAPTPEPSPGPAPPAPGICPNCDGKGKLGDGRVFVTCPVCNGTGKITGAAGATSGFVDVYQDTVVRGACRNGRCELITRRTRRRIPVAELDQAVANGWQPVTR